MRNAFVLLLAVALGQPTQAQAANLARFTAQLANGSRIEGQQLQDWHVNGAQPKLDGKPLLEKDQAFRWLRDRSLSSAARPEMYVEMLGGDRLPGLAMRFTPAVTNDYNPVGACFHVAPEGLVEKPVEKSEHSRRRRTLAPEDEIRVLERYVRRIVWQARESDRYEPGTIFFRDGRQLSFRSARFGEDTVYLLLAEGQQKAQFDDIAELHLPRTDPWSAYYEELAVLSPDLKTRLLQVESTSGLIATASLARFSCQQRGGDRESERWIHGLQPAWSPDMLWIPSHLIAIRRTFAPQEFPLARLSPTVEVAKSLLATSGMAARTNRNVQSGPLIAGNDEYGAGFGVQASSELHFPLPTCVKAFRTGFGIDRAAGAGGCVRGRVHVNSVTEKPLWESDFLQGGQKPVETGSLAMAGPLSQQKELVLVVDPAHTGRPAGADPLDIRDLADWLDPTLELDAKKLAAEVARKQGRQIAAWQGWTIQADLQADVRFVNAWDEARREPDRFVTAVLTGSQPLRLTRELTPGPNDKWLIVAADRMASSGGSPPKIEIRIDGNLVDSGSAPTRNRDLRDPRMFTVPLPERPEGSPPKPLAVEISQISGADNAPVYWHTICLKPQGPSLFEVFDEAGEIVAVDPTSKATGSVTDTDHFGGGTRSIKISAGGAFKLKLPAPVAIREKPEWNEYRYLQFAVRKKGGGRFGIELTTTEPPSKPIAYDGGVGPPVAENARRIYQTQLPEGWISLTCDVFTDFGAVDIDGLILTVPDGEFAAFDAIFLGRQPRDLEENQRRLESARKK